MTRKRFIKLLMGYEVPRNKAKAIAKSVNKYISYEKFFTAHSMPYMLNYYGKCIWRGIAKAFKG